MPRRERDHEQIRRDAVALVEEAIAAGRLPERPSLEVLSMIARTVVDAARLGLRRVVS